MIKKLIVIFLCVACSPSSKEEYQREGEDIAKGIIKILERVHSAGDLKKEGIRLKKEYLRLVDLMILAKKEQNSREGEELGQDLGLETSEALKNELIRVYQLEGCKDLMELFQREILHKLDLYERRFEGLKT